MLCKWIQNLFMYSFKNIFLLLSHCIMIFIVWFSEISWYHHKSQFGSIRSIIVILMAGNKIYFKKPKTAESSLKNKISFYTAYEDDIFHHLINLRAVWFKSCLENALNKLFNILPGITLPIFGLHGHIIISINYRQE